MATMLRYVRYLRRTGSLARRVNLCNNQVKSNVAGPKLQNYSVTALTKNYSTRAAFQQTKPVYGFEKAFQELEMQLRRSGKTSRADIEKILSDIQLAGNVPSLDALLLIRSCGRPLIDQNSKESIQLVQEIWDTLERLRIPMDVSHYNALLSVYLEKDHDFSPAEFLQEMVAKTIEPNRVTYHRLIEAYCRKGDIVNATKILEVMRQKGLPLCENVFNSLITGHAQAGDMKNAEAVFDTMKNAGIEPSIDTYSSLLCAYAKHGDMDSINTTMNTLAGLDMSLMDQHMSEIIETLVANGHIEKAEEFSYKLPKEVKSDAEVGRLLVKLLDMKQLKLALTILKNTTTDPARYQVRAGFILRTAATNKLFTPEEIVDLCSQLEEEGYHPRPWSFTLYHVLSKDADPKVAIALMKAWQKKGGEIREHFFWPMLRAHVRVTNYQGILDTLQIMIEDFKITPSIETLRDYVIPFMFGTWDAIIGKLVPLQIPKEVVLHAIAQRSIRDRKLRNAMLFMSSYPVNYPKDDFLEPMALSLNMFDDTKSFVTILRFLGDGSGECNSDIVPVEIVDEAVLSILSILPKYRPNIVEKVLNELADSGLSMSPEVGEKVKTFLGPTKGEELSEVINKLTSGELKPVPMQQYNPQIIESTTEYTKRPTGMNIPHLRTQFAFYLEKSDGEQVMKILNQLLSVDYPGQAILAQALDLFCTIENMDAADFCYNEFMLRCKGSELDQTKLLEYATLLIKKDRLPDAIKLIADAPVLEDNQKFSRGLKMKARKLLDTIADTKHVENTQQLFELMKSKNYLSYENYSLGPLVKVHVVRNDVNRAMEVFEKMCIEYKCTPYKNSLTSVLIDAEDASSLQKLTDLCTEIHGESNALVDLAFLFLEAGRPHQARKILETTGIQIFNDKLLRAIRHFDTVNRPECLEQITKITRGVVRMDWAHMFNTLMEVYNNKNDWQRGLSLWTEMQEMDITPTSYFLNTLKNLLEKNKQPVPFITDDIVRDSGIVEAKRNIPRGWRRSKLAIGPNQFWQALAEKNWEQAQDIIRSNIRDRKEMKALYSQLIREIIKHNELERAADLVRSVITEFGTISKRAFSDLSDALLNSEKHELFEDLGTFMSEDIKEDLDYYKILSRSQIQKMGIKKYLEQLVIEQPTELFRSPERKIHFGALVHALLDDPSYLEEYEKWANNFATRQVNRGLHVLWNYHFIKDGVKAEQLWNDCVVNSPSPLVRPIIEVATKNKDPVLLKKLIAKLETHPRLNINTKCKVISGLMGIYNTLEQYDEALKILQDATKRYRITLFKYSVLAELKEGLERNGQTFPFVLDTMQEGNEKSNQTENRRGEAASV